MLIRIETYFTSVDGELDSIGNPIQILLVFLVLNEGIAQLKPQFLIFLR